MLEAALVVLFGGAAAWLSISKARNRVRVWREAAVSCGLQIVQAYPGWNPQIKARAGQAEVRFESSGGSQQQAVRIAVEASGPPDLHKVRIYPETAVRVPEIEIGDTAFDSTFAIQGPALLVSALLDAGSRRLMSLVNTEGEMEISSGELLADIPDERIARVLPLLLDLRNRFAMPLDIPRRLAENAAHDPVPEVRLQNLLLLIRELPKDPATAEVLRKARSDSSPEIRLRAAKALGAEARDVLLELAEGLKNDAVSAEAIALLTRELPFDRARDILDRAVSLRHLRSARACLDVIGRGRDAAAVGTLAKVLENESGELAPFAARALGATGSPAAEPPLLLALQSEEGELRVAAADALSHVGSAAAVLPLKEIAGRFLIGDLRRVALRAIDRIQSRAKGAAPGQLSLVEGEAGQLSLASDPAGQLSISGTEKEPEAG